MTLVLGTLCPQSQRLEPYKFNSYGDLVSEHFIDHHILLQSFVQRRFSQQDLNIARSQSDVTVLADARIFNRKQLIKELVLNGSICSDSALILYSYQKWGIQCLDHLQGDFAFAIWDSQQQQLFLASDFTGQRSLYYSFHRNQLYFCNLIRPLFDHFDIPRDLNPTKIANFMAIIFDHSQQTFFNAINIIPPSHYILVKPGQEPTLKRYWSAAEIIQKPLVLANTKDYYENFHTLLQEVVEERFIQGRTGFLLSGGLDSSAITAMAASIFPSKKIPSFCHVPRPGKTQQPVLNFDYDETRYIIDMQTKYPNLQVNYLRDDQCQLFEYCHELHPWLGQPPLNPTNMLWILLAIKKAQEQEIQTLITGQIGNFTISWNGPKILPTTFLGSCRRQLLLRKTILAQFLRGTRKKPWRYYSSVSNQLAKKTGLFAHFCKPQKKDDCHHMDGRLEYFDEGNTGIVAGSHAQFRFLYGVDISDISADKRIVEFCLRTPYHIFRNKEGTRLLIRKGLHALLPESIRTRTSRGIQAGDWYHKVERQKEEIAALLQTWHLSNLSEYIDIAHLNKKFRNWNFSAVEKSRNKKYNYLMREYNAKLLRGIEVARFIGPYL